MSPSYPNFLSSLSQREAIKDTFYRVLIGCDRYDALLFDSAFAGEDVVFEIHDDNKRVIPNLSSIKTHIFDKVGPMDTIEYNDGADTARLTATSLAQHCPPGRGKEPDGPKYTVGGEYSLDFIKDAANEWKIKKCVLNVA